MPTTYTCPHCHKNVRDLAGHLKRVHPDQSGNQLAAEPTAEAESAPGAENLTITPPAGAGAQVYHCVDCGKPVDKGQTPCPHCGAGLDWNALQ